MPPIRLITYSAILGDDVLAHCLLAVCRPCVGSRLTIVRRMLYTETVLLSPIAGPGSHTIDRVSLLAYETLSTLCLMVAVWSLWNACGLDRLACAEALRTRILQSSIVVRRTGQRRPAPACVVHTVCTHTNAFTRTVCFTIRNFLIYLFHLKWFLLTCWWEIAASTALRVCWLDFGKLLLETLKLAAAWLL